MRKIVFWNLDRDSQGREYTSNKVRRLLSPIINNDKKLFEEKLVGVKRLSPKEEMYEIVIDDVVILFDIDKKNIYIGNAFLHNSYY